MWLQFVLFIAVWGRSDSATKIWKQSTSFNRPLNWDLGRVPCDNDRAIFPAISDSLTVQLPDGSTTLSEMVLPFSGEIVLPNSGSLMITGKLGKGSQSCPGEDVVFVRMWAAAWLSPENWELQPPEGGPAVPHLERIPCMHDHIIFPEGNSFRVRLPEVPVSVGSISLLGQELSDGEWKRALMTDSGENQFLTAESLGDQEREHSVVVTGLSDCTAPSGCACPDHSELHEAVCRYAFCDAVPPCLSPTRPLGHCCSFCGSYILVTYLTALHSVSTLQNIAKAHLKDKVHVHVSKPPGGDSKVLQIVVVDIGDDYRGVSSDLAQSLADVIRSERHLGIQKVDVFLAGLPVGGSRWAAAAGTVFGSFLAVLVAMGLIYMVFIIYADRKFSLTGVLEARPFMFARFDNVHGEGESEGEEAHEDSRIQVLAGSEPLQRIVQEQVPPAAFDNPMYGNTRVQEIAPTQSTSTQEATRENPVYSELKRRVEQEEKKQEDEEEEDEPGDHHLITGTQKPLV